MRLRFRFLGGLTTANSHIEKGAACRFEDVHVFAVRHDCVHQRAMQKEPEVSTLDDRTAQKLNETYCKSSSFSSPSSSPLLSLSVKLTSPIEGRVSSPINSVRSGRRLSTFASALHAAS